MYRNTAHPSSQVPHSDLMDLAIDIALSRCIGEPRLKSTIGNYLQRGLWLYADAAFPDGDRIHPAPLAGLTPQPAKLTRTIAKTLGHDKHSWARQWQDLTQNFGRLNARLSREVLDLAFSKELREVVAHLVDDGPSIAKARIEHILRDEARRCVDGDRSKEAGRVSDGTVKALAGAFKRLLRELSDLAQHHPRLEGVLASWKTLPEIIVPKGRKSPRGSDAPPLWLVRLALQQLDANIEHRLGVPRERQTAHIRQMSRSQLDRSGTASLVRDRTALCLLSVVGMRADELVHVDCGDYLPQYVDPDGAVGPALRIFADKTKELDEPSMKPIPAGLAQIIEASIAWVETYDGKARAKDAPLLTAVQSDSTRRYTYSALYAKFAGQGKGDSGGALLPREVQWDAESQSLKADRSYGFPPHRVRAFVVQTLRSGFGQTVAEQLGYDGLMLSVAEALTDHEEIYADRLGYAGESTRSGRIRLSKVGTHVMWQLIAGDDGARRVPDEVAFRRELRRRKALEGEAARLRHELDAIFRSSSGRTTPEQMVDMFMNVQRLTFREREVSDALREVERELQALRYDPQRRVTIPDWLCREIPVVDLDAIEDDEDRGAVRAITGRPALRDWITVAELGQLAGVSSDATPRNWVSGKGIKAGDLTAPWEPDRVPVDATVPRRKKVLVSGLKHSFLDQGNRRQVLAEMLGYWPEGWSEALLTEHAVRPAWMEAEQRRAA